MQQRMSNRYAYPIRIEWRWPSWWKTFWPSLAYCFSQLGLYWLWQVWLQQLPWPHLKSCLREPGERLGGAFWMPLYTLGLRQVFYFSQHGAFRVSQEFHIVSTRLRRVSNWKTWQSFLLAFYCCESWALLKHSSFVVATLGAPVLNT